jgi:crossover junction endodeoxyribonuclease RuvC
VAGTGAAAKEDVEMALRRLLGVGPLRPLDASDALAMAVYHAQQMRWETALQQQNQRQERGQV